MEFTADLHIHTDRKMNGRERHGERPENVARAIVASTLDVYAITEHHRISKRAFEVEEELGRILDGSSRRILGLFGVELGIIHRGEMFHFGHTFEKPFTSDTIPDCPHRYSSLEVFEKWQKEHPGLTILNHPTLGKKYQNGDDRRNGIITELIRSGLINGVEVLNGSILSNGADLRLTKKAIEIFMTNRKCNPTQNIAPIGSSDAHRANIIGCTATLFEGGEPEEIFETIRSGHTTAVCVEGINELVTRRVRECIKNSKGRGRGHYLKILETETTRNPS